MDLVDVFAVFLFVCIYAFAAVFFVLPFSSVNKYLYICICTISHNAEWSFLRCKELCSNMLVRLVTKFCVVTP